MKKLVGKMVVAMAVHWVGWKVAWLVEGRVSRWVDQRVDWRVDKMADERVELRVDKLAE